MDFGLFKDIIQEASQYGRRSFSLHLFGEPTLYPHCWSAIRYIKACNAKHEVLLTTNGTTLNARVDDLLTANPDLVLWSWRPEAKFTDATKAKLRQWGKFRVRFIAEVTPPEAYAEWAGWPNVEGRRLHNYGGTIRLASFQDRTIRGATTDGGEGRPTISTGSRTESSKTRWPCYHLWLAPAVASNGNILLCCADPHQKEVLGQFPQRSVHEVWTGERLRAVRASHLTGHYGGICARCDVWKRYPNLFFGHEFVDS